MTRDYTKILQVPSPTDGSLKRFIIALFEQNSLSKLNLQIGILNSAEIEGVLDINPDAENEETTDKRSIEAVKEDVDSHFQGTSETSVSIHRMEFFGSNGKFCTFERVRTAPVDVGVPNRQTM